MKASITLILLGMLFPSFAYSGEIYGNIKLKNKFIGKGTYIEIKYGTSTSFCKEEFEALDKQKQKQEMEHSQGTSAPSYKDKTLTLKRFCETIMKDNLNLESPIDDINGLNKLLEVPNVYDSLYEKKYLPDFRIEEFKALDQQKQEEEHLQGTSTSYFKDKTSAVEKLCKAIEKDKYDILKTNNNTVDWLNELLKVPNFYDVLCSKKPDRCFSKDVTELAGKTDYYRDIKFKDLSKDKKNTIKKLNRLLLEEIYPQETPKVPEFSDCVMALVGMTEKYRKNNFYDLSKNEQDNIKELNRFLLEDIYQDVPDVPIPKSRVFTKTDEYGTYSLCVPEKGGFILKVVYKGQLTPDFLVYSYESSVQYSFSIEEKDGQYFLRRK